MSVASLENASADVLALAFGQLCSEAAIPVMEIYASDFEVRYKGDNSPVSAADEAAEEVILAGLKSLLPGVPVIAEESYSRQEADDVGARFLLVDPVDGTREFIKRNGEFTINIALVENGVPRAGAVYAPAIKRLFIGGDTAQAFSLDAGEVIDPAAGERLGGRDRAADGLTAVMSRSHQDDQTLDFLKELAVMKTVNAGSSLKFCLLAEGKADVYPRFGPTKEWDVAAGHAVLRAAGGDMTQPCGQAFPYGKQEDEYLNGAFVAWASAP
ncbi:3'(2'),5'-bisphosphate nucleotidase CysQ [Maricaulis sp.]|uniref:3'(2'),5'-bisphosphate nucleotidase CysQ n=1 Tax=Maricaulis sp. TaxID=1486257 RepID=UPI001AFF7755|nr:3'(2'),5'-bisphosphate nucleotidase CysQ [Maricaulis sp.]MBO6796529.1 3'(2'),5'-bisphosphate nucleotidase CysQ [Maricaulis sp.]